MKEKIKKEINDLLDQCDYITLKAIKKAIEGVMKK